MQNRFVLLAVVLLGTTLVEAQSNYAADVLGLNPLGYWRLDGNAFDATFHGSNGTTFNGITFTGPGGGAPVGDPNNQAASLIGAQSQYIAFPAGEPASNTIFDLEVSQPFTFAIWARTSYTAHDMYLIAKQENSNQFRGAALLIDNGDTPGISTPKGAGRLGMSLTDGFNDYFLVETLIPVNDGSWHFLAGTYDGSGRPNGVRLYIDGQPAATTTVVNLFAGSTILNNVPLTVGARDQGGFPYTGLLDEPALYGAPLSAQQIQQLASDAQRVSKVLPQFAFGGGWYTALYFTNNGATAVSFPVNFVNDNGGPLTVPSVGGSSITLTLAPRGTAVVEAPDNGVLNQGYVAVELPGAVTGYGVFRQSIAGIADQEAVVPLASAISNASTFVFDETNYTTAVALVNPSPIPTTVNVTLRDANGALIGQASVPLSARSKLAAVLRTLPGLSAMAGKRGAADFTVGFGNVAVLGLRFSGAAFTSIPATEK